MCEFVTEIRKKRTAADQTGRWRRSQDELGRPCKILRSSPTARRKSRSSVRLFAIPKMFQYTRRVTRRYASSTRPSTLTKGSNGRPFSRWGADILLMSRQCDIRSSYGSASILDNTLFSLIVAFFYLFQFPRTHIHLGRHSHVIICCHRIRTLQMTVIMRGYSIARSVRIQLQNEIINCNNLSISF